jgi:hypothetical protein
VAAIERMSKRLRRFAAWLLKGLGLAGGAALLAPAARAVDLPENRAEAMVHVYDGGGVRASGPALLVRKSVADSLSLSGSLYVDMVSNASIDVVTTASPYRETRTEWGLGLDHVVRDTKLHLGLTRSTEPDYTANMLSADVSQEVYGGMSTVSLGFSRGADEVGKHNDASFAEHARHWQYRLGATQILSPRWIASANLEALSDDGYLGSPYRVARVFGAAVPERVPDSRTCRALKLRLRGDLGDGGVRQALHADARFYRDNWAVRALTLEGGYSRYFGADWLGDVFVRWNHQGKALFYSDNASSETTYVSRNRQLGTFSDASLGGRVSYRVGGAAQAYDLHLNGSLEVVRFNYADFTDIRTGQRYGFTGAIVQLTATGKF